MINPKIIKAEGEQIGVEGCLSVNRPRTARCSGHKKCLEAYDRHGKKYRKELKDLAARACCHELDHLEGILFYDRKHDEE